MITNRSQMVQVVGVVCVIVAVLPTMLQAVWENFTRGGIEKVGVEWVNHHTDATTHLGPVGRMFKSLRDLRNTEDALRRVESCSARTLDRLWAEEIDACEQADRLDVACGEDASLRDAASHARQEADNARIRREQAEKWYAENLALLEQDLDQDRAELVAAKQVADVAEGRDTLAPPQTNWWLRVTGKFPASATNNE